jgi:hypothetical protein
MKMALIITLAAGLFTGNAYSDSDSDVYSLLASIRATLAASDLGRGNPSLVDSLVTHYYTGAVELRREQDEVIPLTLYLGIEERLVIQSVGYRVAKELTGAIVNRSAQMKGGVNISWDDVEPVLGGVCEHIAKSSEPMQETVQEVLTSSVMRRAENWVKNYSDAYSKPEALASPTPQPTTADPRARN